MLYFVLRRKGSKMLKKLLALSLISIALVGCGKSKEEIYDKCLTQANQTFGNDADSKAKLLNGCMVEHGFRWNGGCYKQDNNDMLSAICYVKDN